MKNGLNYNLEHSGGMRVDGTACSGWEEKKEERVKHIWPAFPSPTEGGQA